ncbi:hypothetical protein ABZ621_31790 [Streptomyces sp. NPDC007863]|uniref:hypothetical protein n=1 Tax=Streptomyces sp. NPDC007863 TaxID=3154894 RepID=UPI0033CC23C7
MSTEKEQTEEPPPVAAVPRTSWVTDRLTGQDVARVAAIARHYGRRADRHLAARRGHGRVAGPTKIRETRVPKGTVGVLFPRHLPLCLGGDDVLRARLGEAGPPAGVWGGAADDGAAGTSLGNAGGFVCFTGPTATGCDVAERAARRLVQATAALRPSGYYASDHGSLVSPARHATVGAQGGDACVQGASVLTGRRALPRVGPLFHAPPVQQGVTPAGLLHTGAINVNVNDRATEAGMGGMDGSRLGRRPGAEGIRKYTENRTVVPHRTDSRPAPCRRPGVR